jgi:TetR/AcrR family transcriptional repressor of nem operon
VVNTAIHAKNIHPRLQNCARQTMIEWQDFIRRIAQSGIDRGQLKPETDPEMLTTLLISTLEGAIMLTQMHGDDSYMDQAIAHLTSYLQSLAVSEG